MASRRPLIVNSSAGQIQELTDSDGLIGNGTIPIGGIIMWSGSVATIPTGWALCDGTNSTPNLVDRFVIGASSGTGDTTYPGLSVDATGGSADAVVVEHNHGVTQTDHSHGLSRNTSNGPSTTQTGNYLTAGDQGVSGDSTNGAQANITINDAGVSGTNANLPPYYALAFIMRTI